MKKILYVLLLLSAQYVAAQQKVVDLTSIRLKGFTQEVMAPAVNKAMHGAKMRVAGRRFDNGFSVHAPFSASVYLGKKASEFTGFIGVDDGVTDWPEKSKIDSFARTDGYKTYFFSDPASQQQTLLGVGYQLQEMPAGSIEMIVTGDGKELWRSGILKQKEKAKPFTIDLKGVELLQIKITNGGDNIGGDMADLGLLKITTTAPELVQFVDEADLGALRRANQKLSPEVMANIQQLPLHTKKVAAKDWLLATPQIKATIERSAGNRIILSNGLVSRTIVAAPNAATVSLKNLVTGEEYVRAVEPEAIIKINGQAYDVGGLAGQVNRGYLLDEWIKDMYAVPGSFVLSGVEVTAIKPQIAWKAKRWIAATQWQATGQELVLSFTHPVLTGVVVKVHHKIYDHIPLIAKTISVINNSSEKISIDHFTGEIIAYPEKENFVSVPRVPWSKPNFFIQNDYAFDGMSYEESNQSISWETDPAYTSQVNYQLQTPCIVKSQPAIGPGQTLERGESWIGFNTYILALDGTDMERNTLAQRKMYRVLAPWITENPIFMHLRSTDPKVVKTAVDQCVATGYEMIILSFGSGLNMENQSDSNLNKFKAIADYAHSKGVEIGGYSLFSSRSINPATDVIDIKTGKPGGATFGNAPCLGSDWGIAYLKKLRHFFEYTGFDLLEHDGPYPGDFCAATNHPGHKDYYDSQWNQWKQSVDLYQWLRSKDVYMNTPDFYMLNGANKTGIGYREVNWSLPRAQQILLGRQNIFDGTWRRTPSMGWTFVPLVEYQGGGAAATLEPLSDHLKEYAAHMQQNYGSGVQACYRGSRLYDTEETRLVVKKEIDHYKKYRDILNADIIHLRRPTGRDWDGILHADPLQQQKGFAMLYNPLTKPITTTIRLPLYYTGISKVASVSVNGKPAKLYPVNGDHEMRIELTIPAEGNTWLVLEQGK
ncbi:NPCBM/NEW2 domain-containing protein [Niabella insulamsoli]|uniref:NPCBM/NEW2 domain-containing protein n=1 Tax=Niabella insulamsoli TaxID=3144874 RepID=UPI0031FBADAB